MNVSLSDQKILIFGMGPCGLGTAWRLQELGYENFRIYERKSYPGGLASSVVDEKGFTWDTGGHVQFSHYSYFDQLMDLLMGEEWIYHERSSWVWVKDRFVPYPFQNNIRHLPRDEMWKCLSGLIDLYKKPSPKPENFRDWILAVFGEGIAEVFMLPYNTKVWAYSPEKLSYSWTGDRVSRIDLSRIVENVLFEKDDISWGPNNKFRFPMRGGTGEIWRRLFQRLDSQKAFLNFDLVEVNTSEKYVLFANGHRESYDVLISTIPLDQLVLRSDINNKSCTEKLLHSSTNIIGIGLKGQPPEHLDTKCWMYFPERNCPFYRVTVFSKYSPLNVPDPERYWSLMAEVSESPDKKVDHESVCEDVVQGMLNTKLIQTRNDIVDVWYHFEPYGYPTPSLQRDDALKILRELESSDIYSRGRFGGWKYEVSNQDHSVMQGVELINRLLLQEEEITLWNPQAANRGAR